jgi:hypothetical protein
MCERCQATTVCDTTSVFLCLKQTKNSWMIGGTSGPKVRVLIGSKKKKSNNNKSINNDDNNS